MVKRRLKLLGYPERDLVNLNNEEHYRKLIVWLEDQHIRQYTIDNRTALREIATDNWPTVFSQYCADLNCPMTNNRLGQLEWLLGHAISLDFKPEVNAHINIVNKKLKAKKASTIPTIKSANPLDRLDFNAPGFIKGVNQLADLMKVPKHADHLVTLNAVEKLVRARMNKGFVRDPEVYKGKSFPLEADVGFHLKDRKVEKAAKGLVLLHIQELRELQTRINETIVAVQSITANPKTDTRLGKVGK